MRTRKLIKRLDFTNARRSEVTLGPGTRLDAKENRLALLGSNFGPPYSQADDLYVRTRLFNPSTLKRWQGFEAVAKMQKNGVGVVVTSLGFRVWDGTTEWVWLGAWTPASAPNEWNTEQEIGDNLPTFPVGPIGIVINLRTFDPTLTPEVYAIKLLWDSVAEFQEEYIARMLLPALRSELRPIAEMAHKTTAATTSLDLDRIETPYKIVGIDAVFNTTDDPSRLSDLFLGYNSTTKVVTFSSVPTGKTVVVQFTYAPEVAIATSQDYTELSKTPAVLIEEVITDDRRALPRRGERVANKAEGVAYVLTDGFQLDMDFTVMWTADKLKDHDRLADEVKRFFADRLLRSPGLDELFRVYTTSEHSHQTSNPQSGLHQARLRARICNAVFYLEGASPVPLTKRLEVTGSVEFQVE